MSRLTALGPEASGRLAALHASAFEKPWTAADFEALFAGLGVTALGVDHGDDALAGLILIRTVAGEAEVLTLAVDPARRRRGVGLALVRAAATLAAGAGAQTLYLEVAADNPAALALYAAAGFADVGRRRGYYAREAGEAVDAVVMRRVLNTAAS